MLLDEDGCDTETGVIGLIFKVHWNEELLSEELS